MTPSGVRSGRRHLWTVYSRPPFTISSRGSCSSADSSSYEATGALARRRAKLTLPRKRSAHEMSERDVFGAAPLDVAAEFDELRLVVVRKDESRLPLGAGRRRRACHFRA